MFLARQPGPRLAADVDLLWYAEGATTVADREWVLPSGTAQLLINLEAPRLTFYRADGWVETLPGEALSGPFARPLQIDTREQTRVCGASFVAGGLARFVDLPAAALANQMVGLGELWPDAGRAVDGVRAGAGAVEVLDALEALLIDRGDRRPASSGLRTAVAWLGQCGEVRIAEVASQLGVARRRLAAEFRAAVGLLPKRFQRVRRFRQALVDLATPGDITAVAHRHGYHDQAHLDHDFAELAGMSPSAYRLRRTGYASHAR